MGAQWSDTKQTGHKWRPLDQKRYYNTGKLVSGSEGEKRLSSLDCTNFADLALLEGLLYNRNRALTKRIANESYGKLIYFNTCYGSNHVVIHIGTANYYGIHNIDHSSVQAARIHLRLFHFKEL